MMTAYDVLKTKPPETEFTAKDYDQLIKDFQASYWEGHNFQEILSLHRRPQEFKQEMLQDLYDLGTRIQRRPELQDFDPLKNSQGYSHVRVQEIWAADRRLRSIYNATKKYCEISGKDFQITLIHVAEYRALNLLIKKLRRNIHRSKAPIVASVPPNEKPITKKRKGISAKIRRELQKEANSKCPFCNNGDVAIHEVHHIDEDRGNDAFENLIHICGNCHSKITVGTISREAVVVIKQKLLNNQRITPSTKTKIQVQSGVTNITTGNHASVIIKQTSKKVVQKFPPGCIGYEIEKANYIGHLISRYNEYKLWETGKEKMSYGFIYTHLKRQFKLGNRNILNLPLVRFEELAFYLQQRIDRTKLAKVKGNSHRNYQTFGEHQTHTLSPEMTI
jgi:5-methylcytosine-specific restriction endonuclease McrA